MSGVQAVPRARDPLPILPRLMRRELAALYLGVSVSVFDVEVAAARLPRPVRVTRGIWAWDRQDLDQWIDDRKVAEGIGANPWDAPR